jgi:hypothetical protein
VERRERISNVHCVHSITKVKSGIKIEVVDEEEEGERENLLSSCQ